MLPYINRFDRLIATTITHWPAGLRPLMELASLVGQPSVMAILAGAVAVDGRVHGRRAEWWAGLGALGALLLSNLLKLLFHRTRPDTYTARVWHSYSFPSGHAMGTMVVLGLVAWLAIRRLPAPWGGGVAALCAAFVVLVGVSRVYLGAHYPSDVLGGWVLGAVALSAIIAITKP